MSRKKTCWLTFAPQKAGNILLLFIICTLLSCAHQLTPQHIQANNGSAATSPDYADLRYWAAHPLKKDLSDSIPLPLRTLPTDTAADVFFIHPTTFTDRSITNIPNAFIDDEELNDKTDHTSILYQASIFNGSCKVYAPRYRQAYLGMYVEKDSVLAADAFALAYSDVRAAFQYYLENYNHGRPIVIASHSQGTTHAKRLLKEFFDDKPLQSQLVCAYLIGMPVEKSFYTTLPVCHDSLATGCIAGWRTYRNGYLPKGVSPDDTSLIIVNPVTWSTDPSPAAKTMHKGAVLYSFNSIAKYPHTTQIAGNALWISKPRFRGGAFYFKKNYHIGDFNLFYLNVREDVARRIREYRLKNITP